MVGEREDRVFDAGVAEGLREAERRAAAAGGQMTHDEYRALRKANAAKAARAAAEGRVRWDPEMEAALEANRAERRQMLASSGVPFADDAA